MVTRATPVWPARVACAAAAVGLAVSVYLGVEHFTSPAILACPADQLIDCRRVTSSAQSLVFGVPVALLGVAFFAAMVGLTLPVAWRSRRPAVRWLRPILAGTGVAFVLYLLYLRYAELFVIDAICLWCTVVHVAAFIMSAAIALAFADDIPESLSRVRNVG
jgi:uncharacterized membrane protein